MEERTPLLPERSSVTPSSEITTLQDTKISYVWELTHLAAAAAPISLSFATQNVVQACSIMVAGKIGTFELGVASYGYMFASCTGSMVAIGGSTAIDTLCAQAFNPETPLKNSQVLGTILQRGLLVLSLLFAFIITPIWWYSRHLFVALGQDAEFAKATCEFLRILIPGGLLQVVSECLKKFLQVQQNSYAVGWITAITSILGAFANIILINSSLGLWGAPVANAVYNTSNVLCLLLYIWCKPDLAGAMTTTMAIFEDLIQFSILAMTGILTVATEWWGFEILAMMAAALDNTAIGAQSILMTSDLILATLSLGLGVAASHRIGNLLGADKPSNAEFASRIPYLLSVLVGLLEFFAIMAARDVYGYIFSDDDDVVELAAQVLPLMAGFQVLDLANGGAGGILRGAGKTHQCGICNFVAYYGVGLTTSWYLGFRLEMGLFGLWSGIITGSFALLVFQTFFVRRIDWQRESELITERSGC